MSAAMATADQNTALPFTAGHNVVRRRWERLHTTRQAQEEKKEERRTLALLPPPVAAALDDFAIGTVPGAVLALVVALAPHARVVVGAVAATQAGTTDRLVGLRSKALHVTCVEARHDRRAHHHLTFLCGNKKDWGREASLMNRLIDLFAL
jgi:hypothetical protein